MILVAGGTGTLGRSLIPLLAGHGGAHPGPHPRRARPVRNSMLPEVEAVIGDVRRP